MGIGKESESFQETVNWDAVETMAVKHGLMAVVYDAVQQLPESQRPLQVTWLRWIGQVMQGYEARYVAYRKAVVKLASFYNSHGNKMMLLKGLACGRDWPKPEHRTYGDIDIWLFGQQKEADSVMTQWFKSSGSPKVQEFKIDNSHHHHTAFNWLGFIVENHYDFINVHHHKSNVELEGIFKELGQDDGHYIEIGGERLYLPSPNLHVLFLLKHLVSHFASERMSLRQLLDWAFFVEKHTKEIDWVWLLPIVEDFHMKVFFYIINAICVEDLGFQYADITDILLPNTDDTNFTNLKKRVLAEILSPEFSEKVPKNVLWRIPFKYRRWKANEWKHRLCYNESMYSAFWSGVRTHLLKPSSI